MPSFNQNLRSVRTARSSNVKAKSALYKAKIDGRTQKSSATAKKIAAQLTIKKTAERKTKEQLHRSVERLYENNSPQQLITNWSSQVPVLLMPLRIETRFMESAGVQELWVRIYPDDIAVQQHEPLLTENEFAEGKKYWDQFFDADKTEGGGEDLKKTIWESFRNLFGPNRTAWVARQTVPVNWADKVNLVKKEDLIFPDVTLLKSAEWSQAPYTKILPDKFVVSVFKNNKVVYEQAGNLVPDTLMLGPDPFQGGDAFTKTDFGIEFAKEFLWMSDFEEAVKVGMGLKIKLKNEFYTDIQKQLIEHITVLGIYLSADSTESASLFGELLESHRYTEGLAIIPQGTPTNNTENFSSGFIPNEDPQPKGYFDVSETHPFQKDPLCDGNRLVSALGINASVIEGISKDDNRDHAEAVIMNGALFPATIGYYFDTLLDKYVPDKYVRLLRNFFENHITGGGPLPAIRVGDQPYGILVTSDFPKWKTTEANQEQKVFHEYFQKILNYFSSEWEAQINKVLYVGREKNEDNNLLTAEEIFLDIVGLEPSSVKFERRSGFLNDLPAFKKPLFNLNPFTREASNNETLIRDQLTLFGAVAIPGLQLFSSLLFKPESKVYIPEKKLIDGLPVSEIRPLKLIEQININYLSWLTNVSSMDSLEKQDFSGAKAPNYLLYLLGRHSLLLELRRLALEILSQKNGKISASAFDKTYLNLNGATADKRDLTIWEVLHADISKIEGTPPGRIVQKLGDKLIKQTSGNIKNLKSKFASLSGLPTARLERLLIGHLDCLTYRLDAWHSGLFYERLDNRRKDVTAPVKGIFLGAFGYLENLKPAAKTLINSSGLPQSLQPPDGKPIFSIDNSAGLLHAPSLDHAAAAALLMAGYRNHATPQEPGAFSVNLSSSRIRKANNILEGVRNGQSVESLLGYQFERACHDRKLNQYLLAFRNKYRIENQFNKQEGEAENAEIFRAVQPNVVNGLKIAKEKNFTVFEDLINNVTPGLTLTKLKELSGIMIEEAKNLADTLDAIKDLLLSESVFQVASGNTAHTGAVLESLREGNVPPDPGIIKTPRRNRFAFNLLIAVHFPQTDAAFSPWGGAIPLSPRSQFEPGLNVWLSKIFGNPANIICSVSHINETTLAITEPKKISLADLKIQPVDFLFYSGKDSGEENPELERRISFHYRALLNLPPQHQVNINFSDNTIKTKKSFAELFPLVKSLHSVLSQARAIHAGDYLPFAPGQTISGNNKNGYEIDEMRERVRSCIQLLEKLIQRVDNVIPNNKPKNEANPANLNLLFKQWEALNFSDNRFSDIQVIDDKVEDIIQLRMEMAGFDISNAWPINIPSGTRESLTGFLAETAQVWRAAHLQLENAKLIFENTNEAGSIEEETGMLTKLAKLLLGGSFPTMPKFNYHNQNDITLAARDEKQVLKYFSSVSGLPDTLIPDDWLQSVSAVRSKTGQWEFARSLAEIHGTVDLSLTPVQLPYRKKDSWLAVQFPQTDEKGNPFAINTNTISCAIVGKEAFNTDDLQSGLLIDEWSESIPVDTETSGIAFNYNQPDSMPPQALLLAVYPGTENTWNWDSLLGTIMDTMKRAKMRAVEPRHFEKNQLIHHFLPGIIAPVNIAGGNISLDFAVASDEFLKKIPPGISLYEPHLKLED